ncbi:hypothetical protein N3114_12620 (plasmid) [Aliarcobacter butzleri]|uniref:hypothetical protein n=1 Tax=Aliarcobacter butzleri TaxID=28197 RepID=UPI0021B1DBEC|nr:hypothetical protein [Aliarcobacter butzleri]UXC30733.1 hypothetical protein N3114_12620 [Aliarcobacter butzleri]
MKNINLVCNLFGIARRTYFHWKKDINKNKSINLIEKYFTKEELEEFITNGKIEKQELIKDLSIDEIQKLIKDEHNQKILEQIENLKKELI